MRETLSCHFPSDIFTLTDMVRRPSGSAQVKGTTSDVALVVALYARGAPEHAKSRSRSTRERSCGISAHLTTRLTKWGTGGGCFRARNKRGWPAGRMSQLKLPIVASQSRFQTLHRRLQEQLICKLAEPAAEAGRNARCGLLCSRAAVSGRGLLHDFMHGGGLPRELYQHTR